jgi:hypothetical protein
MSYLGKISALVTVNTGDFAPKLNAAAGTVRSFAKTVQAEIGSSMRQTNAALQSMYTPLQRFERSLQAAAATKLQFAGFKGAIRSVEELQQRMAKGLNDRQVSVILKTTGMANIKAFETAIQGLDSKSVDVIARVGGLDKLQELRRKMVEEAGAIELDVRVSDAKARVQELRKELEAAKTALDAGGESIVVKVDAEAVSQLESKLTKASTELDKLLAKGTRKFGIAGLDEAKAKLDSLLEDQRALTETSVRQSVPQGRRQQADRDAVALNEPISQLQVYVSQLEKAAGRAERIKAALETARAGGPAADVERLTIALADEERALDRIQKKFTKTVGVDATTGLDVRQIDAAIPAANALGISVDKVQKAIDAISESDLQVVVAGMRQTRSVAEEIAKPLGRAAEQIASMSAEVAGQFLPAMVRAQAAAKALEAAIESGEVSASDIARQFGNAREQVERTTNAANRLYEAYSKLSSLKTGTELQFSAPGLSGALDRSARVGNAAAALPASAVQGNSGIAAGLVEINNLSKQAVMQFSWLQRLTAEGLPTANAQKNLDAVIERLNVANASMEQLVAQEGGGRAQNIQAYLQDLERRRQGTERAAEAQRRLNAEMSEAERRQGVAFVITGRPQNMEQARGRLSAQESKIGGLDRARRQNFAGLLDRASLARDRGDLESLQNAIQEIDAELARFREYDLRTDRATAEAKRLRSTLESISSIIARPSMDQLRDSARTAAEEVKKVADAAERARLQARLANAAPGIARIADLPEDQRDAAAQSSRDEVEEVRRDAERQNEIDADRRRRAKAASRLLVVNQSESGLMANEGAATRLGPNALSDAFARQMRGQLGQALDDPQRGLGQLRGSITSIKSSLDSLPLSVRQHFLPAITAAEQEFMRLNSRGIRVTAEEIDNAANNMRMLEADTRRAAQAVDFLRSAGGENAEGILRGVNARSMRGYVAELEIIQAEMGRTENAARRMAAAMAAENFRQVVVDVEQSGQLNTPAGDARIDAARRQVADATVGGGRASRRLQDRMRRAGDVSRGGFDNWSLALNQAAFAVDDFMSSTGGLEFKLRAISNNITQMAFILGGTTGLFVGLGAVIAGQAAVGLLKWINNGRTAEDQTKALNDSLARQKSLVEELAQAFRSLGDSMSQGTFSEGSERGRKFGEQVTDIERKQREQQREAVVGLDPQVIRERAQQNALNRRLGETTDVGQIVAIQEQLRQSRERERVASDNAASRPAPTMEGVRDTLRGSVMRMARAETVDNAMFTPTDGGAQPDALREAMEIRARAEQQAAAIAAPGGVFEARSAIRARITELSEAASTSSLVTPAQSAAAKEETRALELLLRQLEAPARRAADQLAVEVARSAQVAAAEISSAQNDVAEAIRRGVPAALGFQVELDRLASELSAANVSLTAAQQLENADEKVAAVNRAEARIAEVRGQRENVIQIGREARLGRGFGGERLTSAISAIQGNERFRNQQSGLIAQARGTADNEFVARQRLANAAGDVAAEDQRLRAARERRDQAVSAGRPADAAAAEADIAKAEAAMAAAEATRDAASAEVEAAQKASDLAASILEFALSVEQAISRIRKIGDAATQTSERGADSAQQAYQDNPFRAGAMESRDAAERRLIEDRAVVERAQNAVSRARDEAMATPEMQALRKEREALESSIKDREAAVAKGKAQPEDARALEAERNRLVEIQRKEEQAMQQATAARRKELDAINSNIAAREKELERSRQRDAEDPTTNRQRRRIDAAMSGAEQLADEAQQRFDANPTQENRDKRDAAEARVRSSREKAQKLQDDLDRRRQDLEENDPALRGFRKTAADAAAERAAIRDKAKQEGRGLTQEEKDRIAKLDKIETTARRQAEDVIAGGTRDEQSAVDKFNRQQVQRSQADRGRLLGMTERERFREEFSLVAGADIRARAAEIKAQGGDPQAFMDRAIAEQAKTVAPMLEEFRMERENAMLQGPSRAALQVSDVTTTQGQAELNRLLRGDDSAKDVNLAELREQSAKLQILIDVIRNNPLPVWEAG